MNCDFEFRSEKNLCKTDVEYINGLKEGNSLVTHRFFYELCRYNLNEIRSSLMHGMLDYDDLVNELYLYLSADNWHKLDTFSGINGCKLASWTSRLSWHFFMQRKNYLLGLNSCEFEDKSLRNCVKEGFDIEDRLDLQQALASMSNERYVKVFTWLVIEGYTPCEVAKRLNTNVANVYNIKHRAIKQFFAARGISNGVKH